MPESSLTIPEFCAVEKFSRSLFYKLKKQGKGPRTYAAGAVQRITPEAHQEWRRAMEAETVEKQSTVVEAAA
jgi:hypothetical protein